MDSCIICGGRQSYFYELFFSPELPTPHGGPLTVSTEDGADGGAGVGSVAASALSGGADAAAVAAAAAAGGIGSAKMDMPPTVINRADASVTVLNPLRNRVLLRRLERKTLVLDLDETLVHSTLRPAGEPDLELRVHIDSFPCVFYVFKRPHVDAFLRQVAAWYDVVVFTASLHQYANPVLDALDPDSELIAQRYFRESCTLLPTGFAKDVSITRSDGDLAKAVLVDNSPSAFMINRHNAIPIETWQSNVNDEALLDLLPFLNILRFVDDVRSILSLRVAR
ncbi:serine/threonine-protein phosphatase dullard-A [Thecamonas trahens ATCC 50062]|uniref:Serine/threonine-protein phosphatase dullard-A n=1 Tax=Thecamonas trahens ATCC 50062 TaxID=461836 RepID=A0A0L0DRW7_THETB|nr:serine/threonine-protein phosphatase dullard-A [Thecamonas trahens ATCC 50062]KNC54173.1 serine/threonine-protein phosphatase dullard-A [Thecamonas trahens ATCC 50062]|eukprot:XP_013753990.1 serine/threonine-protein phosphatase dullard-A [Thecamonas trahens ATCC 50062]